MKKFRHYLAITLGSLLTLFVLQNLATIEINFLFWSFQTHRFLIIAFSVLTGVVIGMLFSSHTKPNAKEPTEEE